MKTFISLSFIVLLSFFSLQASNGNPSDKKFVIVIDAGHGGKDSGNSWHGFYEKNIALDVALRVGKELEKYPDIKVIYTRSTDVFVPLHKRAEIANKANADLLVSIHCNGHNSNAHGTETFVLGLHRNKDNLDVAMKENSVIYLEDDYELTYDGFNPKDPTSYIGMTLMQEEYLDQSILLADFIQKKYTKDLKRIDRGVKQAGFLVLRETYMPSVLTEIGFLSYKPEGSYLNSKKGKGDVAKSIIDGILNYKKSLSSNALNIEKEVVAEEKTESSMPVHKDPPQMEEAISTENGMYFTIQLAAGSNPIPTEASNFKGLKGVSRNKEGRFYKYYFGKTTDYLKIQEQHRRVKDAGYKNSYIVAFKNGKKISVNEALKSKAK